MCADPSTESAAAACCPEESHDNIDARTDCKYVNEVVKYETAAARCAARSDGYTAVCSAHYQSVGCAMESERSWLAEKPGDVACKAQVQVLHGGIVSLVHPGSTDAKLKESFGNVFRARWAGGLFPNPTLGCPDECSSVSAPGLLSSCLCDATDTTVAVFNDTLPLPKPAQVLETLRIGSPQPDSFPDGVYTPCSSKACNAALKGGVTIYTHADANGSIDDKAIFMVLQNGTRPTYLANLLSTVSIGAFSFRNTPKFHSFVRPTTRDAEHETEALLDHLFYHKNTAPFISRRLIQRLSTSNPSPCLSGAHR